MIGWEMKSAFFDAEAVIAKVDAAKRKTLSKGGAMVRTTARQSIRLGKKPSAPGSPPKNRTKQLKNNIFFAWDAATQTVIVGPHKLSRKSAGNDGEPVGGTVPQVLEESGEIQLREAFDRRKDKWVRPAYRVLRFDPTSPTRVRIVRVEARPYMQPARDKNADKLAELWKDAVN